MEPGWLRIYFSENAYTTVPAMRSTTASALCAALHRKRQLPDAAADRHALFVTDAANEHVFERRLLGTEHPLEVQEKIRKHGNLDHFRLVYRALNEEDDEKEAAAADKADEANEAAAPAAGGGADGGDSGEEDMFSPAMPAPRPMLANSATFAGMSTRSLLAGGALAGATVVQPLSFSAQAMAADPTILRCGYLEKRGKRNTAWKERWFVLRGPCPAAPTAAPSLSYFKSHLPSQPIAIMSLQDAFVRPCHTACVGEQLLPFVAAPSVTNLTLSPALPVPHAHSSLSKCSTEFEIDTLVRLYSMRARSYPEMHTWVQALRGALPACVENDQLDSLQIQIEEQEFFECDREEKRLAHIMTLSGLLKDAIAIEQFVQFETENHSEENVLFYLEVEGYFKMFSAGKSKAQCLDRARAIFQNFLAAGAPQEIHIPGESRTAIQAAIASGEINQNLFQQCQQSVFTLMQASSFANFLQSKHFQRALLKLSIIGSSYTPHEGPSALDASSSEQKRPLQRQRTGEVVHQKPGGGGGIHARAVSSTFQDDSNSLAVGSLVPASNFASSAAAHNAAASSPARPAASPTPPEETSKFSLSQPEQSEEGRELGVVDSRSSQRNHHQQQQLDNVSEEEEKSPVRETRPAATSGATHHQSSAYGVAKPSGAVAASNTPAGVSAAPLSHGPVGSLTSQSTLSAAELACYLESIGVQEAQKRSASLSYPPPSSAHASANNASVTPERKAVGASSRRGAAGGSGGDSDSSESEAEEPEEESIFDATPKVSSSVLDDDRSGSFSQTSSSPMLRPSQRTGGGGGGGGKLDTSASSSSSPFGSDVVTEEVSEDFFTHSRTRSVDNISMHTRTAMMQLRATATIGNSSGSHAHAAGASPPPGLSRAITLPAISEGESTRPTPASSVWEEPHKRKPAAAEAAPADAIDLSQTEGRRRSHTTVGQTAAFASTSAANAATAAASIAAPSLLSSALAATAASSSSSSVSALSVPVGTPPSSSTVASPAAVGLSSTKWKKNRSIFDDDDDGGQAGADEPVGSYSTRATPLGSPAAHKSLAHSLEAASFVPVAGAAPAASSSAAPAAVDASADGSSTLALALLQEQTVDLADLNLDLADARGDSAKEAESADLF